LAALDRRYRFKLKREKVAVQQKITKQKMAPAS